MSSGQSSKKRSVLKSRSNARSKEPRTNQGRVCVWLRGQETDSAQSDIDLMVIGDDLIYSDLYGALQTAEKTIGRTVNPTIMDASEWQKKRENSAFIQKVSSQPKIFIFGSKADL